MHDTRKEAHWLLQNAIIAVPALLCLAIWEVYGRNDDAAKFFFSYPSQIITRVAKETVNGLLLNDLWVTAWPTVVGLTIGMTVGSTIGFSIIYNKRVATLVRTYVLVLGAIPIFAIAPMMIIWFGIGALMKIAMAFFSTVFVALGHAYSASGWVDTRFRDQAHVLGATRRAEFGKIILPTALDVVIMSFRLNANLALLGVFIGEFIASEAGLGHRILAAGSLYDVSLVWAAAIYMLIIVVLLNATAAGIANKRFSVLQVLTVPHSVRVAGRRLEKNS